MGEKFDPYYKWLGIPPKDQPPHYYRLLGIETFEQDREVIDAAANRLMGYLKDLAVGDESAYSQQLLNEIARARLCLLNKEKKSAYDEELRRQLDANRDDKLPPEAPPPRPPKPSAPPTAAPPSVPEIGPPVKIPPSVPASPTVPPASSTGAASSGGSESPAENDPLGIVIEPPAGGTKSGAPRAKQRRPVRTRRYSRNVYAAATLIIIVGGIGLTLIIVMSILLLTSDGSKRQSRGDRPSSVNLPVLVFEMSDEELGSVQEFLLNDVPQPLPMKREYVLEEGRHRVILKRPGFQDYFDSPTLVNDQHTMIDPAWLPE